MAEYLKRYQPASGFKRIVRIGDSGLRLTEFGLINLGKGGEYSGESGDFEIVLIILSGTCSVTGEGFSSGVIGARRDVFSGKPYAVYIPRNKKYSVTAATNVDIAWTASPSDLDTGFYVITPRQVKEVHIGKDNYQRDAYLVLTDKFPSKHLYIGEAFVPSGNHASYPPHRHDFDNPPAEVDMEEIYFFRFDRQQGYGVQKIYTDERDIDVTCTVRENDTTLIPRGYHPVVNAPGYTMYYLWIMAGAAHRTFVSVVDPAHKWLVERV